MEKLVICGDSFNYGIGCMDCNTQPYGVLLAKHFNLDLIRLARGSASNYAIYLQGEYAATLNPKIVILGTTSTDRFEWVAENKKLTSKPSLNNLNYHDYPPHHMPLNKHDEPMDYFLKNDSNYDPMILTEQIPAIFEYRKLKRENGMYNYYRRLHTEPLDKLEKIENYYVTAFDSEIKADYDRGVILMAYRKLKNKNIKVLILSADANYIDYVDDASDFYLIDWASLILDYPDKVDSGHISEEGHSLIASNLKNFLNI